MNKYFSRLPNKLCKNVKKKHVSILDFSTVKYLYVDLHVSIYFEYVYDKFVII